MGSQRDLITLGAAALLHVGVGYALSQMPSPMRAAAHVVALEVRRASRPIPPERPYSPAAPAWAEPRAEPSPPPAAPHRRAGVKRRPVAARPAAAPPAASAPPPAAAPARPLFGVSMDSLTDGPSVVAVPVGDSTRVDPGGPRERSGPPAPSPSASPAPAAERPYRPVSSVAVKTLPEIDSEACGRGIPYPPEARAHGIEGDVVLRVELDDTGKVRRVRVISGLGHGLDQAAVAALTGRCTFTPALDSAGRPVAYIIPAYTFHFELPR